MNLLVKHQGSSAASEGTWRHGRSQPTSTTRELGAEVSATALHNEKARRDEKMKSMKSGSWEDVKLGLETEAHVKIRS